MFNSFYYPVSIHNVCVYIAVCCFPRNTVFTKFHYDVCRQGIEIYPCIKFCLSQCFPLSVIYMRIHIYAIKNVLAEIFLWFFQEIQCLHNFNHDDVRHVTELYLSTKFHVCQCCS